MSAGRAEYDPPIITPRPLEADYPTSKWPSGPPTDVGGKLTHDRARNRTAERVLRVANDHGAAQYIAINQINVDPYGRPMLVNAIGQVDVDIIIDEGPTR